MSIKTKNTILNKQNAKKRIIFDSSNNSNYSIGIETIFLLPRCRFQFIFHPFIYSHSSKDKFEGSSKRSIAMSILVVGVV